MNTFRRMYSGDPQTAVTHIGDVVIFLQTTLGRYHVSAYVFTHLASYSWLLPIAQLGKSRFILNERKLTVDLLNSATVIYRIDDLKGEDAAAFNTWYKALFDSQIEGIEDSVLR